MNDRITALIVILILLFAGCTNEEPRSIVYGEDTCAHCRMLISDKRFGSELVTDHGKVLTFDSIECLVDYTSTSPVSTRSLWVTDFDSFTLINVESGAFVKSDKLKSPMGGGLAAFTTVERAKKFAEESEGKVLVWNEVRTAGATIDHESHTHH